MAQAQRTAEQLILAVRQIANQELAPGQDPETAFAKDSEILRRLIEAQYELYDMMLTADPQLFATSFSYQIAGGASLDLTVVPAPGFYRMVGLDLVSGSQTSSVHRFTFAERNKFLALNPDGVYTLWYTPRIAELVLGGGKLDVFTDNYQKWLISAAAAVIMAKAEESDPSSVLADKATEGMRILGAIAARNSEPEQIPDITEFDYRSTLGMSTGSGRAYSIEGTSLMIRGGGGVGGSAGVVPVVAGASFYFSVADVAALAAYPDALLVTSQAQARVRSPGRTYSLEANTGNPDDSATTANFVNAPSGRQWIGE